MKKVKSLRVKNELFYSLKKLKGILNYIIIITGDTVKCGVNIVIYATQPLRSQPLGKIWGEGPKLEPEIANSQPETWTLGSEAPRNKLE